MQQGINLEDVKRYNASLREYKEKSSKIRAEIEFNEKELARQCEELTKELGVTVTAENIREILQDRVNKITSTMQIGNEILGRIKAEEQSMLVAPAVQTQPPAPSQPIGTTPNTVGFPPSPPSVTPPNVGVDPFSVMSEGLPPIFAQQ